MNIIVDLPPETVERLKDTAAQTGKSLEGYLKMLLVSQVSNGNALAEDEILDAEYLAECAKEADPSITLESVHQALAKISGSMTSDFIAERDER